MSGILPSKSIAPTRINPKILVLYGMPKVGKTGALSSLDDCLILDTEGGADIYENKRIRITSIDGDVVKNAEGEVVSMGLNRVYDAILEYGAKLHSEGKKVEFPYKYIAIDTLDVLEEFAEVSATATYKKSVIGKNFEGKSVIELPQGGGYYYLRNEVLGAIEKIAQVCKHLILITHIKEKLLNKGGIEVSHKDISLTGKLGQMVCAKSDAIGYLYREPSKPLMVSFATNEGAVMGARFERLAGKKFEFDWSKIYIDEPSKV